MAPQQNVADVIPEVGGGFELDENVIKTLPSGCRIMNSVTYGTAAWTRAARIIVNLEDGSERSYFLKCASDDQGKQMIEGEYASMKEIEKYTPSFVPTPCASGQFKNAPIPTYFFLMEFVDMITGAPDPASFCQTLAELHRTSQSETGKFGFRMTTCHGPHPQNLSWEDSWAFFFGRLLRQFFDREINTNGPDRQYEATFKILETQVIRKLLEPLQAEGRYLKPSLVHGDLWEENAGTDIVTGQSKVFDAAVFYGHNEYDLGMWRRDIIKFGRPHMRQYLRHMPPSEPRDQWDDRNRLYCIKFEIAHAIGWPASAESQRQIITNDMKFLIAKYS